MREDLSEKQERNAVHVKELVSDIERVSDLPEDLVQIAKREGDLGAC